MDLKDKVSLKIIKICEDKKIDLKELSNRVGYTKIHIEKILRIGEASRRFPIKDVDKFAKALEVPVAELFMFDDIDIESKDNGGK